MGRNGKAQEFIDNLRQTHKEIVASLEWCQRGDLTLAKDRARLAKRFLDDALKEK